MFEGFKVLAGLPTGNRGLGLFRPREISWDLGMWNLCKFDPLALEFDSSATLVKSLKKEVCSKTF